jgi:hypothetical protein
VTVTQFPIAGSPLSLGATIVTFTATDSSGNFATCIATVTVADTTPPVISDCGLPQTGSAGPSCSALVPDFTAAVLANDNCTPSLTVTQAPVAGTSVGLGVTNVTLTVADAAGNSVQCSNTFTVNDTTNPTITTCALDQTVSAGASCDALVPDFTAGVLAADNCDPSLTVTQSPTVGTPAALGTTAVLLTVTDDAGNFVTCSANLTVNDTTPPTISSCGPAQSGSAGASCTALVPDFTSAVAALDNCSPSLTVVQAPVAGTSVGLGVTSVTLTVTDGAGNSTQCSNTFTVNDTTPPAISNCGPAQSASARCEL